jgi:DNA-binding MarR family transcriptional regulator
MIGKAFRYLTTSWAEVVTRVKSNLVSASPEEAFRELIRTLGLLERVMQPYFARHGISGSQWSLLRSLHRAEGQGIRGLRQTDLSERLLIRPPSVTGALDRLQRSGLVTRGGSASDHRAKLVSLTAKGRNLVERVLTGHQAQIETVMAGLRATEQSELCSLLGQLRQHLELMLLRMPC